MNAIFIFIKNMFPFSALTERCLVFSLPTNPKAAPAGDEDKY